MKVIVCLIPALILGGCVAPEYQVSRKTRYEAKRLRQIRQRTGGDWNRLTPEEKRFLVDELSQGNEATAPMLLGAPEKAQGSRH